MALRQNIVTNFGMDVNAYMRVEKITFQDKQNVRFSLNYYAKTEAYPHFQQENFLFPYDLNGENVYAQAYSYLKSLEKFKTAIDC